MRVIKLKLKVHHVLFLSLGIQLLFYGPIQGENATPEVSRIANTTINPNTNRAGESFSSNAFPSNTLVTPTQNSVSQGNDTSSDVQQNATLSLPSAAPSPSGQLEMPPPPTVDPPSYSAKAPDRQRSSAMAKAMALGGMAQSMVMCMYAMNEARKAEDPKDKALMMMAASKLCEQGKEFAKAAQEADKGQKLVSQQDIPAKQAQLRTNPMRFPPPPREQKVIVDEFASSGRGERALLDLANLGQLAEPNIPQFSNENASNSTQEEVGSEESSQTRSQPVFETSIPSVISGRSVSTEDLPKNAAVSAALGGALGFGSFTPTLFGMASNKSMDESKSKKDPENSSETMEKVNGKGRAMTVGVEESGASGADRPSSEGGGGSAFESMLSQILGNPTSDGGSGVGFSELGQEWPMEGAPSEEKKRVNIFEYASYRLSKLIEQNRFGVKSKLSNSRKTKVSASSLQKPST